MTIGQSQLVEIPHDLRLAGERVLIRKDGDRLILEPEAERKEDLIDILARLSPIEDYDFPEIDDPPPEPVNLW